MQSPARLERQKRKRKRRTGKTPPIPTDRLKRLTPSSSQCLVRPPASPGRYRNYRGCNSTDNQFRCLQETLKGWRPDKPGRRVSGFLGASSGLPERRVDRRGGPVCGELFPVRHRLPPLTARSPRVSGAVRGRLVATVLLLALASCTGQPDQVAAASDTVAMRTSGSIADGFEIEPGSALIGAVFPAASAYGGGHEAVLRVDGEIQSVLDGYVQQAEDLGFSFEHEPGSPGGQKCRIPERAGPYDALPECTAQGVRNPDELEAFVTLRAVVEADGQGLIFLSTTLRLVPNPSPLPSGGPVAPATDVELAPGLTPENYRPPVRVVEGSALVLGPIEQSGGGGGYVAMLQVTGELLPVMRGYLEQLPAVFDSQSLLGDADEPRVVGDAAGGGDLIAVGAAGAPSYVLIALIESDG